MRNPSKKNSSRSSVSRSDMVRVPRSLYRRLVETLREDLDAIRTANVLLEGNGIHPFLLAENHTTGALLQALAHPK